MQQVLTSSFSIEEKLKILPVLKEENFVHLFSKIGLFQVFAAHGINTPPSFIAHHFAEGQLAAETLGYPVLIKRDSSGGGAGVFECRSPEDFQAIPQEVFNKAVLVQKKLPGIELDLSAIFLEGDLVHFSHAKIEKRHLNCFGPSCLRLYTPLSGVDEAVFHELRQLGKALGVHGFTNISCIQQADGRRFYFEADVRPNVWVDFPRFFAEDASFRIQNWFSHRETLRYPVRKGNASAMRIPYFLRLKSWELLCNRYRVWQFIPVRDKKLIALLILHKVIFLKMKWILKRLIPHKFHPKMSQLKKRLRHVIFTGQLH